MTMRPQFGSSPAIAVLTSGELAMASATLPRVRVGAAPVTAHLDELGRPLAVAHHLMREVAHDPRQRRLEGRRPRVRRAAIGGIAAAGRRHQQRVRGRGVAVDGDAVEGRVAFARATIACSSPGATAASVKRKTSIVAMSGAIMPEPLAKPAIVTGTPPSSTRAAAPFGKVSVVMIARAARSAAAGAELGRAARRAPRRSARPAAARR